MLGAAIHENERTYTGVWNDRRFRIRHAWNPRALRLTLSLNRLEPSLPENPPPRLARSAA